MRLVWVQQWSYLPVIVEDIDMNSGHHNRERLPSTQLSIDNRLHSSDRGDSVATCMCPGITPPFLADFASNYHDSKTTWYLSNTGDLFARLQSPKTFGSWLSRRYGRTATNGLSSSAGARRCWLQSVRTK